MTSLQLILVLTALLLVSVFVWLLVAMRRKARVAAEKRRKRALIAAAVMSYMSRKPVRIASLKKEASLPRSGWSRAAKLEFEESDDEKI